MSPNKHYAVEILSVELSDAPETPLEYYFQLIDTRELETPFGDALKHDAYAYSDKTYWILPREMVNFHYQTDGFEASNYEFLLELRFDSSFELDELNREKFLYSLGRRIQQNLNTPAIRDSAIYIGGQELSDGSIRSKLLVGLFAVYPFVASYSDIKQSVTEILKDTEFMAAHIQAALKASEGNDGEIPDRSEPGIERFLPASSRGSIGKRGRTQPDFRRNRRRKKKNGKRG